MDPLLQHYFIDIKDKPMIEQWMIIAASKLSFGILWYHERKVDSKK